MQQIAEFLKGLNAQQNEAVVETESENADVTDYEADNSGVVDENEVEAVEWYKKAALQGHVESMMKLGLIYYIGGDGIPEDDDESNKWYKMAAKAGNKEAKEKVKYLD